MYREAPIKNGMFDYNEFTKILKHGANEKDEAWTEKNIEAEQFLVLLDFKWHLAYMMKSLSNNVYIFITSLLWLLWFQKTLKA